MKGGVLQDNFARATTRTVIKLNAHPLKSSSSLDVTIVAVDGRFGAVSAQRRCRFWLD
jgi:hypothetical protein